MKKKKRPLDEKRIAALEKQVAELEEWFGRIEVGTARIEKKLDAILGEIRGEPLHPRRGEA